ncbi:hypothetical protein BV20DRAFT_969229 [Pilatotrama ljubarskyi]|nr:hypothetical protein BV20DRAFT_969229 [Pilatotrama ljubarskyi]
MIYYDCRYCAEWFYSDDDRWDHEETYHGIWRCEPCDKAFSSPTGLHQHYVQSPRHPYCQKCRRHFDDFTALRDHYNDQHYYCTACGSVFDFEIGLHEHCRQKHADRYCVPCKKMFQNANNLDNHRRSAIHQGRTIFCPMQGCGRSFVSTAALVLHFESGACVSRVTRDQVNRFVAQIDRSNIITNPTRMIGGPAPMSTGGSSIVTRTWATERAWNGTDYECYLCHRTFRTLPALNQHLDSPAHAEKLYRCPRAWYGCGAEFSTLSAFCQHVEGAKCGVRRFQSEFDRVMGQLSGNMKRLTMGH